MIIIQPANASQPVQALPPLRRQHGPARLEQVRLGEDALVLLPVALHQQGEGVLDVAADDRQALQGVGVLLHRRQLKDCLGAKRRQNGDGSDPLPPDDRNLIR